MQRLYLPLLFAIGLHSHAAETSSARFSFRGDAPPGFLSIRASALYADDVGYGFESGGMVTFQQDGAEGNGPFLFSAKLPEGTYRVVVTTPPNDAPLTIKSESRRLMIERTRGTRFEFIVNTRNAKVPPPPLNAPGGDHVELNNRENSPTTGLVYHWDDKLTLEFNGPHPAIRTIEIAPAPELPTVFLAGDSTVTDQPREPGASWGQMLPRWFKPTIAVANHAESGETLKSFITELRLDKVLSQMKRGDFLVIQFGHNDEKQNWPQTYVEAGTTYKAYLKVFITEARRRGATPILVSPMQRRQFDADGKIRNSHGDYPAAVAAVAKEENVAFIDLAAISTTFYESLGPEQSVRAFSSERDITHHNNYGAYQLAKAIAAGLRATTPELAKHLVDDFPGFDPAHPDDPGTFALPASPGRSNQAPRGN